MHENSKDSIRLSGDVKIIIYGAGVKGNAIRIVLERNNYNVIGYIDKNACNMQNDMAMPVYALEAKEIEEMDKSKVIVVVSVANIFVHEDIVSELQSRGFLYFICKINVFNPRLEEKKINKIYDDLYLYGIIDKETVIPYVEIKDLDSFRNIYDKKKQFVYCYVPLEMLFTIESNYKESTLQLNDSPSILRMVDKNIMYFVYCKKLYETFNDLSDNYSWRKYLDYYKLLKMNCAKIKYKSEEDEHDDFIRHLKERYKVYLKMEEAYHYNYQFFKDYPIIAKWNQNGYFNIEDGANRAAFLMAKGMKWLPVKIIKEDYHKWKNEEVANIIKSQYDLKLFDFPIENPYFMRITQETNFYQKVCQILLNYLGEENIKIEGMNIYQINAENGYIARQFARSRANVTIKTGSNFCSELELLVNRLVFVNYTINNNPSSNMLFNQDVIINLNKEYGDDFDYSLFRDGTMIFSLIRGEKEDNRQYNVLGRCYYNFQVYTIIVDCVRRC